MTSIILVVVIVAIALCVLFWCFGDPDIGCIAIILVFTAVFVFGMNQVANELDHVDYDSAKTYDTAVMSKDIIVDGTSVSYYPDNKLMLAATIVPIPVPRQPNIAYTLYCLNPIDTLNGEYVRFRVDKEVYQNTSIGQSCKMKVYMKGNTVVKARLLGNKGEVGMLY